MKPKLGGGNFPQPLQWKLDFRQRREGHPKSCENSTNSYLAQTFRVTTHPYRIVIGDKNFILSKKKGGGNPKSDKNATNSDLAQTFKVTSGH